MLVIRPPIVLPRMKLHVPGIGVICLAALWAVLDNVSGVFILAMLSIYFLHILLRIGSIAL